MADIEVKTVDGDVTVEDEHGDYCIEWEKEDPSTMHITGVRRGLTRIDRFTIPGFPTELLRKALEVMDEQK